MAKILLSGYYGFDNAGDEAVLLSIIDSLRSVMGEKADITVLSNEPDQTANEYQVKAVNRWGKKAIYQAIKDCDLLISGGGSLLQDVTSKNGILYYLGIIWLAKKFGKKVVIYSQGIGPINEPRNRKLTAKILNKVDGITVRDFNSRLTLMDMGVNREIQVSVDPVLGVSSKGVDQMAGWQVLKEAGIQEEQLKLMVSVRPWQNDEQYLPAVAEACDYFAKNHWQVIFVPFHYPEDVEACHKAAALMKEKAVVLEGNYTPKTTLAILKNSDLIIGMRLHALIMGVTLHKPIVALSYDPKVDGFMQSLKLEQCLSIEHVSASKLIQLVEGTWQERTNYYEKLLWRMEIIEEQAKAPAVLVDQLLSNTK